MPPLSTSKYTRTVPSAKVAAPACPENAKTRLRIGEQVQRPDKAFRPLLTGLVPKAKWCALMFPFRATSGAAACYAEASAGSARGHIADEADLAICVDSSEYFYRCAHGGTCEGAVIQWPNRSTVLRDQLHWSHRNLQLVFEQAYTGRLSYSVFQFLPDLQAPKALRNCRSAESRSSLAVSRDMSVWDSKAVDQFVNSRHATSCHDTADGVPGLARRVCRHPCRRSPTMEQEQMRVAAACLCT
jgi:hypothetical protein